MAAAQADLTTDVLVVGCGAIGASSAFHLARAGVSVLVVDQFDGPAQGSTGRCFASVRGQWADDLNIEVSWRSICAFRDFPAEHGIDVGYVPSGYLFLVPQGAWSAHLEAVTRQRTHGVPVDVLDLDTAAGITPFDPDGVHGATWGPADGVVDPHGLTAAYLDLARRHGARTLFQHRVTSLTRDGGSWRVDVGGQVVSAATVVNAAGGWAGDLARLARLEVPVRHSPRTIYAGASGAADRRLPMTIDLSSGTYLRSEGDRVLFGGPPPDSPAQWSTHVDWPWMEHVLDLAVPRFPWLSDLPLDRDAAWAGTYEMSPDSQGILGPHPGADDFYNACGFSGHGFMQAPEIGRLVAEEITTGTVTDLDVTPLRLDRFLGTASTDAVGMVF